jgi:hypothetical protein
MDTLIKRKEIAAGLMAILSLNQAELILICPTSALHVSACGCKAD